MKNIEIEIRNYNLDFTDRSIEGKAIVFEQESKPNAVGRFSEIIHRSAISEDLLNQSDVKLLLNHDEKRGILARNRNGSGSLELELTEENLIYRTELPNTTLGEEVREGLIRKDLFESSFAFVVEAERWERRKDGSYLRHIDKIKSLHDVSIVLDGAYANTDVDIATRNFEAFLLENPEHTEEETFESEITPNQEEVRSEVIEEVQIEERSVNNNNNNYTKELHTHNTMKKFSLLGAINDVVNNRQATEETRSIIEAGQAELRNAGREFAGQIQLPLEHRATISAFGDATNPAVKEEKFSLLEPLYANMVLSEAGATFMTGLNSEISIPTYSGSSCTWSSENGSSTDGAGTFGEVKLSPKRLTAHIDISKSFLNLTDPSAEALLRADLVKQLAQKIEATILGTGAGTTTNPGGLLNGVTADTVALTYQNLIDMEGTLDSANIGNNRKYIVSPQAKSYLRSTPKISGNPTFMMSDNGDVCGNGSLMTSNVASKGILFGDFSELIVGFFGGLDMVIDPYTLASQAKIRIVVNMYVDAKLRRAGAVAKRIIK